MNSLLMAIVLVFTPVTGEVSTNEALNEDFHNKEVLTGKRRGIRIDSQVINLDVKVTGRKRSIRI